MMTLFNEFLLIILRKRTAFTETPAPEDWHFLYSEAERHALLGVAFSAVEIIPVEQRPPKEILLQWIAQVQIIENANLLLDRRTAETAFFFQEIGFQTCVLKGQGIARLYPESGRRQCGDIDIWVEGSRRSIIEALNKPSIREKGIDVERIVIHHADLKIFQDAQVEVHFIPSYAYNPLRHWKYLKFFNKVAGEQFLNYSPEQGFATPTFAFNCVYSLMHIYRHVFYEGIGLRQLMDYYYILERTDSDSAQRAWMDISKLGLKRFAAAVMYVEEMVFGLEREKMLCAPDEKAGKFLLMEILHSGNFGQYDNRIINSSLRNRSTNIFGKFYRLSSFLRYYPSEVIWAPFWKLCHWGWSVYMNYLSPTVKIKH